MNIALIFPGQGIQKVAMGKELYDSSQSAKAIFDKAEQILNNDLKSAIFEGPQEKLTSTAYCQPAIVATCMATLEVIKEHPKYKELKPVFAAGLSLGEYSALIAAGAFSLEDGLRLIEKRSFYMEEATKMQKGAMAAIIGLDKKKLIAVCNETGAEIANYNSNEQTVITGAGEKVEAACKRIQTEGAKSVIPLDVAGAFHSSLMKPAAEKFKEDLAAASIKPALFPVIANVDAKPQTDPEAIRGNLAKQITSSVQWVETVKFIAGQGVTTFLEIGPSRVLKGLIRKIDPSLKVYSVSKPEDLEKIEM